MSYDELVDSVQLDANLASVANAIRGKNGTSEQIPFPDGFVAAINALATGGALTINTTNLHDTTTDIADTFLGNGIETAYSGWSTTDYIPIVANTVYAITSTGGQIKGAYCAIYSANKKYIERLTGGIFSFRGAIILWKSEADGYIRFSGNVGAVTNIKMYSCVGTINEVPSV